jgi:methionine sulfoxide reductase heme-binding subunit
LSNNLTGRPRRRLPLLEILVHPLSLLPLGLLLWDLATGSLGVNPIQELTLRTGLSALILLLLALAATPLNTLLGWRRALPLRKPLGLYAFLYATLHALVFFVVDYGLDLQLIWADVGEKRYIYAGLGALLLLTPLALTSTRRAMRRLGKRWKPLHRLVYLAAALAVVHFVWLVKADVREPLLYGAALALLLALRIPALRRLIVRARQGMGETSKMREMGEN